MTEESLFKGISPNGRQTISETSICIRQGLIISLDNNKGDIDLVPRYDFNKGVGVFVKSPIVEPFTVADVFNQNSTVTNFIIVSAIINRLINEFQPLTIVSLAI
jgi:hypothetical protein